MAYWAIRIPLQLLSYLPWWALYVLSDLLYFLIFRVIGYRRALVQDNLRHAFPEKSESEREEIAKQFYRNLCDMAVETLKLLTATPAEIRERFQIDFGPYRQWQAEGRSILQASGHFFNWEWANWLLSSDSGHRSRVIYMMTGSPVMGRLLMHIRQRHGSTMVAANDLGALLTRPEVPTVTVFLADQNPSELRRAHWTVFLGRKAPFHRGMEIMARRTGQAVVFEDMVRTGRGRYRNHTHLAFADGSVTTEDEITEAYARWMEGRIREHPENWLWTHNRWKHKPR
jgi:KDO2-lipid IV(A) lauroyltransferase